MTVSSYLELPLRAEEKARALARAKIEAEDEYKALMWTPTSNLTMDERIDLQLRVEAAREKLFAASRALQARVA